MTAFVLCFLWGTNWIYICYVEESRLPLWSSGQSSWLHNGDVLCCEVRTEFIYVMLKKVDRLCGLVVRVPSFRDQILETLQTHIKKANISKQTALP
jgi:hypothetical protein